MPAKSRQQQKAAGAELSVKRGEAPKSKLRRASKRMVKSMSEKDWRMAGAKRSKLPRRASSQKTRRKAA